jgi:hypothetical protein
MKSGKQTTEKRRSFGGKLDGFIDKYEAHFEQKHLKAYLKGQKYFTYGLDRNRNPIYHEVKEIWTDVATAEKEQ